MKVITDVHIFKSSDDIRTYKALWDTGATETLISNKVITESNILDKPLYPNEKL